MGRASTSRHERDNDPTRSPLWPVALILGEIAERLERRRAEEHAVGPVEDQNGAGRDPRSRRDGAR